MERPSVTSQTHARNLTYQTGPECWLWPIPYDAALVQEWKDIRRSLRLIRKSTAYFLQCHICLDTVVLPCWCNCILRYNTCTLRIRKIKFPLELGNYFYINLLTIVNYDCEISFLRNYSFDSRKRFFKVLRISRKHDSAGKQNTFQTLNSGQQRMRSPMT